MKRFLICLMTLALLLSMTVTMVSAADYEDDESILLNVQLQNLYLLSGYDLYSDLAEDYFELWWEETDGVENGDNVYYTPANINLRGFAMSPNGDYAYLGTLNGGDGLRGVVVLDTITGVCTDLYYHKDVYAAEVPVPSHGPFSYAKGIDADDRGYVYVGFAFSSNYNVVNLGIAKQETDGTLTEVSFTPIWENGLHGDTNGTHIGVNGVDVVTIGEKTYCYVVVNYDHDAIYCFDVTDPANPVLNEEFGEGGFINFSDANCPVAAEGVAVNELQYLDVDEDGTVYIVLFPKDGTNGVMVISPDGKECINFYTVGEGNIYSPLLVGDFLLCGSKSGAEIFVVNKESGEELGSIVPTTDAYGDRISRLHISNDVLYVCDAGSDNSTFNAIYAGALSDSGLEYLRNVIKSLNGELETEGEDTAAPDTTPGGEETKAPDAEETKTPDAEETKTPDAEETTAPAGNETSGDTAAESKPAESAPSTDKIGEEEGCASLVISGGAVAVLLAAAYVVSKRK